MTSVLAESSRGDLPTLIDRATFTLTQARSAAEILDAKEAAELVYDLARRQSRLEKAKGAHDELASAALRLQADANEIIAAAQRRLADEYDAAQDRGEVRKSGGDRTKLPDDKSASVSDIGLTHKDIHEARIVRDAEAASPGVTRRVLDEMLDRGKEPTKAALSRALKAVVDPKVSAAADRAEETSRRSAASTQAEPIGFDAFATWLDLAEQASRLDAEAIFDACPVRQRPTLAQRCEAVRAVLDEIADLIERPHVRRPAR